MKVIKEGYKATITDEEGTVQDIIQLGGYNLEKPMARAALINNIQNALPSEAFDPPGEGGSPMTKEEIRQIATVTADEVMDRVRERERDSLLLHSIGYAYGSPGIVVDEVLAKATPCRCIEYRPGKKLCFSKGIVGALSNEQEKIYCPTTIPLESPGLERRLKGWMESVETCKAEIAEIPKGERLAPWLGCMSRELRARGIGTEAEVEQEEERRALLKRGFVV